MEILIIGDTASSSLLAFRLAAVEHKVTVVGRANYVRGIKQHGLLVEQDGRAERAARIDAVGMVEELGYAKFDLIVIATKAFDTAVAAVQIHPLLHPDTQVIVIQNGVGGIESTSGILGEKNLYAAVMTIPVQELKPAVIRPRSQKGGIGLAPIAAAHKPDFLVELFTLAQFTVRPYRDWRALKWSKLMLNILANAIPAILDWPLEKVYADRRLFDLERTVLREAREIVRQMGLKLVSLPGYPVPLMVWACCTWPTSITYPLFQRLIVSARGGKRPSLHTDLLKGYEKSEIDFLNGAVARAGKKLGIETPANRMLYDTLLELTRKEIDHREYMGQVARLLHRTKNRVF